MNIYCNCDGFHLKNYLKIYNITLGFIRIGIENYFGTNNLLWSTSSSTYKWNLDIYNLTTKAVFVATDHHEFFNPIRNSLFQLFEFTNNNELRSILEDIAKYLISKECFEIIGFETDEDLIVEAKYIGDFFDLKSRKQGTIIESSLHVLVLKQITICESDFIDSNVASDKG